MHDDILVCRIHLWGGLIALAEIRERAWRFKSGNRFRSAPAIRAMTRFAARFAVHLLTFLGIGVERITEILGMREASGECNREGQQKHVLHTNLRHRHRWLGMHLG